MVDSHDYWFMERALFVAERGRGRTSPNPTVGAVVVSPAGIVVGQGAHLQAGSDHAEVVALEAAAGRTRGATLYVTLEPCCHQGRTPPCVDRIVSDGIARVVYAATDPNPNVTGGGGRFLESRGVAVTSGVMREAAEAQIAAFALWAVARRPFIIVKSVVTEDGFVGPAGSPMRLSGAAADRYFHAQRAEVDAIAVGSSTVLTDDPLLTSRNVHRARPLLRVIFDWRMRIPHTARVFSTLDAGPVIMVVLSSEADHRLERQVALEGSGIALELRDDRALEPVVRWFGGNDMVTLVVEGGPALHEAFFAAGLVDRVQLLVTPRRLGRGVKMAASLEKHGDLRRPVTRRFGRDRLIEWDVHGTD